MRRLFWEPFRLRFGFFVCFVLSGRFSVCYHDLGCIDNTGWFRLLTRPINLLPASRDKIDTRFLLYTRNRRATVNVSFASSIENS